MELGIGAGWKRDEWLAYGYGYPETAGNGSPDGRIDPQVINPNAGRRSPPACDLRGGRLASNVA